MGKHTYGNDKSWKYNESLVPFKVKCKHCGHTFVARPKEDKVLCDYCGMYTPNNSEYYFMKKIKEKL